MCTFPFVVVVAILMDVSNNTIDSYNLKRKRFFWLHEQENEEEKINALHIRDSMILFFLFRCYADRVIDAFSVIKWHFNFFFFVLYRFLQHG